MKEPLIAGAQLDEQRAARISALPRWAQQYTAGLERKIAELEARVAGARPAGTGGEYSGG